MRQLKPSERRLSLIFAGIIFLAVNFFALNQLTEKKHLLESDIRNLRLEETEAGFWLAQSALWQQRKAWLDEKQPKLSGTGQESGELLQNLQKTARQQKITISQQVFPEAVPSPYYHEVSVQLEVKGTLESVTRWIASLQNPDAFLAVTIKNLKSDAEAPNVICSLLVARWYALP